MAKLNKRDLQRPSGFPDLSPEQAIAIRDATSIIREEYELAGFSPLTTSIVERPEVLTAKNDGEILNQIYGLRLLNPATDSQDDSKDLALRFDHTVPLARYVASLYHELEFPFRRYAIGAVFRGERPKDGRYRQFTQADIDIIGSGSLDLLHDAEMVAVIARIFSRLDVGQFTVRIGHRKVLQGLLQAVGLNEEELQAKALQEIDRLEKIGRKKVTKNLCGIGMSEANADALLQQLETTDLSTLANLATTNPLLQEGVEELVEVLKGIEAHAVDASHYQLDLTIARGLAYYTGTVYETRLDSNPGLGSIASGGRYENLTGAFSNHRLPGVGISIGVTRMMKRLIQAGIYPADRKTVAPVLVAQATSSPEMRIEALKVAAMLRQERIATEVYVDAARLSKQLQFADRRGFTWVVILGIPDMEAGHVALRKLATGEEERVPIRLLSSKLS